MATKPQKPKGRGGLLCSLNVAIDALDLAKEISAATPAKAVFGSVSALLTVIRVRSLLFCGDKAHNHVSPGLHGQRTGLRRSWVVLR